MAKVVLIEVETAAAGQICRALATDGHQVERRQQSVVTQELLDADIVFAGGEPAQYLLLLKRVREVRPTLPFVVVTRIPETSAWLNALEAGATDCCAAPIETRQLRWLVESALPRGPLELRMSSAEMKVPQLPQADCRARTLAAFRHPPDAR